MNDVLVGVKVHKLVVMRKDDLLKIVFRPVLPHL